MPVFAYRANDESSAVVSGTLTAETPSLGRQLLRDRGLQIIEFKAIRFRSQGVSLFRSKSRRDDQVGECARHLAMLLRSGVPLVDALDVLISQTRSQALLTVLRDVRERVASGTALSDALEQHPLWFDRVFCSAVRVGQLSGHLEQALSELSEYVREKATLKGKLFSALAYPMILTVLGFAVVLFLMTYVVPQLLGILEAAGRELPAATQLLMNSCNLLIEHFVFLIAVLIVTAIGTWSLYRWLPGRRWIHSQLLRLPLYGALSKKSMVADFAQKMSLLLRSGVPFVDALALVRGSTGNVVLCDELDVMEEDIKRGSDIAPTLACSKIFPPLVVHVVHVGQQSGELSEMLVQLKEGYETEVRLAISKFTAALEPILIVIMSIVVGFVVYATLMPILETTRTIH